MKSFLESIGMEWPPHMALYHEPHHMTPHFFTCLFIINQSIAKTIIIEPGIILGTESLTFDIER
jgi:hypothetical protein